MIFLMTTIMIAEMGKSSLNDCVLPIVSHAICESSIDDNTKGVLLAILIRNGTPEMEIRRLFGATDPIYISLGWSRHLLYVKYGVIVFMNVRGRVCGVNAGPINASCVLSFLSIWFPSHFENR
jgi:hypothetical protein